MGYRPTLETAYSDESTTLEKPELNLQACDLAPKSAQHAECFVVCSLKPAEVFKATHFVEPVIIENGLVNTICTRHPVVRGLAASTTRSFVRCLRLTGRLSIRRHYAAQGLERYGFCGLFYAYLMEEFLRFNPPPPRTA